MTCVIAYLSSRREVSEARIPAAEMLHNLPAFCGAKRTNVFPFQHKSSTVLHCGNSIPAPHPAQPVVNNTDPPLLSPPVKNTEPWSWRRKKENSLVSLRPLLLSSLPLAAVRCAGACRWRMLPVSFPRRSHLLSTASLGAQEQGRKLTEPRSHPRGLAEGLWRLTQGGARPAEC